MNDTIHRTNPAHQAFAPDTPPEVQAVYASHLESWRLRFLALALAWFPFLYGERTSLGVERLAWMTGFRERAVRSLLRKLRDRQLLIEDARGYRLDVARLATYRPVPHEER